MEFQYSNKDPLKNDAAALVVAVDTSFEKEAVFKQLDSALSGSLVGRCQAEKFEGKAGQSLSYFAQGSLAAPYLILVGCGSRGSSDTSGLRDCGATGIKAASAVSADSVCFVVPKLSKSKFLKGLQLVAEGAALGAYRFDIYKKSKKPCSVGSVHFSGPKNVNPSKATRNCLERASAVADAISNARDLVNEPAASLTPGSMATRARALAKANGLTIKVLGEKECAKLGMNMYLAVGRGSDEECKFIHLTYKPTRKKPTKVVALVGKGVTFDSGGYSLKPSAAMVDMKIDMGGSAAVISAMAAIAKIGCPYEVHAFAACAENLVNGSAYKLGDVLTAMDGTTVEINNTDAEGRLTLGDAISYAKQKVEPDEIFDFATLTGACMVALGPNTAGVMSDHQPLVKAWLGAAERADESMWRLPLDKSIRSQLDSPIADMRNTGERWGGAMTAGMFLQNFVKDTPWVHVDLAGPASTSQASGVKSRGGTGFAVASIVEYLCS